MYAHKSAMEPIFFFVLWRQVKKPCQYRRERLIITIIVNVKKNENNRGESQTAVKSQILRNKILCTNNY